MSSLPASVPGAGASPSSPPPWPSSALRGSRSWERRCTRASRARSTGTPDFGPNVDHLPPDADRRHPGDPRRPAALAGRRRDGHGPAQRALPARRLRHAADPLQVKVGYYTEIAGLGASPEDVTIHGELEVYNRCLADGGTGNCLALVNFWRTISNLSLIEAPGRTAAAPRRTSGPCRRRSRCAASTSPAATCR